jgi:hypothetical protein
MAHYRPIFIVYFAGQILVGGHDRADYRTLTNADL